MPHRRTHEAWLVLLLIVVPLAAFLPTLWSGFVNWDDPVTLIQNEHVHGFSWQNLQWAWTNAHLGEYRPLAWLLFALEFTLWRGKATGYHAMSLFWHVATTLMLAALCVRLLNRLRLEFRPWVLVLVLLVFQVHPLRAEVVAWVSIQSYLPSVFFALLAAYAYLGDSARRSVSVPLLFFVSLSFKAVTVPFPFVLLLFDRMLANRAGAKVDWRKKLVEKLPLFALSFLFAWLAVWAKKQAGSFEIGPERTFWSSLALPSFGFLFFVEKFFAPFGLRAVYSMPEGGGLDSPSFVASVLLVVAAAAIAFAYRKRAPAAVATLLAYAVLLLPSVGLVRVNFALTADRYGYLPLLAFVPLAVVWLSRFPKVSEAALVVTLIFLSALTWKQTETWQSSLTLWKHVIDAKDPSHQARNNYGSALVDQGDFDEAFRYFTEAVRRKPTYAEALDNLGLFYMRKGRLAEAEKKFSEAVASAPKKAAYRGHWAVALLEQGKAEAAGVGVQDALAFAPEDPDLLAIRGVIRARQKRYTEASRDFEHVLRLRPGDEEARRNLQAAKVSAGATP